MKRNIAPPLIELMRSEITRKLDVLTQALMQHRAEILDPERMMTTHELATLCQVDDREVHRWVKLGLPHYPIGHGFRFKRYEALEFVNSFKTVEEL